MFFLYSLISQTKTHLKCHRGSEMSWFNIKRKWDLRSHWRHRALAVHCPLEYIILNYQTSLCHSRIERPVSRDVNKGSLLKTRILQGRWAPLGQAAFLPSPLEESIPLLMLLALPSSRGSGTPASSTHNLCWVTQQSFHPSPQDPWQHKAWARRYLERNEKICKKKKKYDFSKTGYFYKDMTLAKRVFPQKGRDISYSESSTNHIKSQQNSWPIHPLSMEAGAFSV